jgi:glycosyltransferase involved in cell wall biosynthesis
MDRANHALAGFLARRGDDVRLVAHRVAPDLLERPGVTVRRVPRPLAAHLIGAPLLARAAAAERRSLPPGTRALMNGGNGALGTPTWVHYLHAAYEPEVAASVRTKISAVAGRRYYLARERAALAAAHLVICNSRRTAADLQRLYGVPDSVIRVVYYGVDAAYGMVTPGERAAARSALGLSPDAPIAIFIGALGDRRKGFDLLFDAWRAQSASAAWDARLIVAGAGGEREAWARRAASAGLGDRVMVLGFRTDVVSLLAAADVLVHPARYEAYGLGVHEAICRGLPAIVSGCAGVAERFPASLAPLVLPDAATADDVARALGCWRGDMEGWRRRVAPLACALRARTWDDMAAEIAAAVEAA